MKLVLEKIKGVEAVADKTSIRKTGETGEWKCRICSKTHAKGKCGYTCPTCKKKGRREENCWFKDKRDRSESVDRKKGGRRGD